MEPPIAHSVPKAKSFAATATSVFGAISRFAGTSLARWLVLGLFVAQAVVLVFVVKIGTPPDETNHIQFIEFYAHHSLSPVFTDQQPTWNLGDKTREVDYVYHYTMSLLYRASPLSTHATYMGIRLLSVVFALLCFLVLANLFWQLGVSATAITVGLLVVTNLPMVLMMSSAVNNDVLVWLGMACGLWLTVRLWRRPSTVLWLWLAVLTVFGGLIKRDLLPLCMVFGGLALVVLCRNFRSLFAEVKRFNWRIVAAGLVLLLGIVMFSERIGGNVVRYGTVVVSCQQVRGADACYDFWATARLRQLARTPPEKHLPPVQFAGHWAWDSAYNIVDIQTQAWRHEVRPANWLTPLLLCLLIVGMVYGLLYEKARFATDALSRYRVFVAGMAWYYILVNLAVNFSTYRHLKFYGIALNGRYIIPSVLLLTVLASFYWSKLLARHPRLLVLVAVCSVLGTVVGSGLLMMLRNRQLYHG